MRGSAAMLLVVFVLACTHRDENPDAFAAEAGHDAGWTADARELQDSGPGGGSTGCGRPASDALGGVQIGRAFTAAAGGERSFYLVVPADYDENAAHRVVFGFAGTNWTGEMIRPYLDLERPGARTIYVYPDALFRDFEGWGHLGGWLLGPHATPANGMDDLNFVGELLDQIEAAYCVDRDRVFATGHSWGGDMAAVSGCFLGDRLRAVAPVAANRPYWFEPAGGGAPGCVGSVAVWTFFGEADDHFTSQPSVGAFGLEQDRFWREANGCGADAVELGLGAAGECVEYSGCAENTRLCLYGAAAGHQRPPYFADAVRSWFGAF